jgi:hypothetical protein
MKGNFYRLPHSKGGHTVARTVVFLYSFPILSKSTHPVAQTLHAWQLPVQSIIKEEARRSPNCLRKAKCAYSPYLE